jgi:hypothetical protein
MNIKEEIQVESTTFKGIYNGEVISIEDPDGLGNVKVRVTGVYNAPVKKEHIPMCENIGKERLILGDDVIVFFFEGDHMNPLCFKAPRYLKIKSQEMLSLYETLREVKTNSRVSNVDVNGQTFTEPDETPEPIFEAIKETILVPEDVATVKNGDNLNSNEPANDVDRGEPSTGLLKESTTKEGEEYEGLQHQSGTFLEIQKDGSVVIHTSKEKESDFYEIVEGSKKTLIKKDKLLKVEGKVYLEVNEVHLKVGNSTIDITTSGIEIKSADTKLTGQSLQVAGTATPTGTGALCAIPVCPFSGALHTGDKSLGN